MGHQQDPNPDLNDVLSEAGNVQKSEENEIEPITGS